MTTPPQLADRRSARVNPATIRGKRHGPTPPPSRLPRGGLDVALAGEVACRMGA